ncbi:hypothetical protein [Virgibacillus sp. 6R]|uniref:hypothetical protein n=1 Tax=Metabacillus sp. 22489 TaxID=3453928 RepID=UPI0016424096
MFNEYEVHLLSKLKREEMGKLSTICSSIATYLNSKTIVSAKEKTKPIDSIFCCKTACC